MKKLIYSKDRLAEARELRKRWYTGEDIPRTPFVFTVNGHVAPYSHIEMCQDGKKATEVFIASFQHQFDTFPDCDFLPVMHYGHLGQAILASMYGAKQLLDEHYPPFTEGRVFKDIYETEAMSNDFEVEDTEWGKKLKEHLEIFIEATDGQMPLCVADYQSPYGTATKLLPDVELMIAMYDEPELFHKLMSTVTDGIIKLIHAMEKWAGPEIFTHNMYNPIPGACGLSMWDDYISVITPALHQEFCVPYNLKLFELFGYGHLHTCGPLFPGFIDSCLACKPRSMDIIILRGTGRSKEDLINLFELTSKAGVLLFGELNYNEVSLFDPHFKNTDDEFLFQSIPKGYLPSSSGSYEEGLAFAEKIKKFDEQHH